MVCPKCASSNIVTLKGQRFCVNCGHALGAVKSTMPDAQAAIDAEIKKIIKPNVKVGLASSKAAAKEPVLQKPSTKVAVATGSKSPSIISHRGKVVGSTPAVAANAAAAKPSIRAVPQKPAVSGTKKPSMSDIKPPAPKPPAAKPAEKPAKLSRRDKKANKKLAKAKPATKAPTQPEKPQAKPVSQAMEARPPRRSKLLSRSLAITGGLVALLVSAKVAVIYHTSATTPGGFFRYLAYLPPASKQGILMLLPGLSLAAIVILVCILWQRAISIYTASRAYDHRPAGAKATKLAAWNSVGSILWLGLVAVTLGIAGLVGLLLLIKLLQSLAYSEPVTNALGVAVCFFWVLAALWLGSSLILAKYSIVLSGQNWFKSLRVGMRLASRNYTAVAALAMGMSVLWLVASALVATSVIGLAMLTNWPYRVAMLAGLAFLLSWPIATWLLSIGLHAWTKRFRQATQNTYGNQALALYRAGRTPKPVSKWGIGLSICWWVVVVAAATWALNSWRFDPTPLLRYLANTIY